MFNSGIVCDECGMQYHTQDGNRMFTILDTKYNSAKFKNVSNLEPCEDCMIAVFNTYDVDDSILTEFKLIKLGL